MLALLAGLAGAIAGWLLKTFSDLLAERRANERADIIWRRTKYVDAVAELLLSGRALMAADSRMSRAVYSLSNAESGGNAAILEQCQAQHRAAVEAQEPWTTATIRALESVRLYGPDSVVVRADALWEAIYNGGHLPDVSEIRAFEQAVTDASASLRAAARVASSIE